MKIILAILFFLGFVFFSLAQVTNQSLPIERELSKRFDLYLGVDSTLNNLIYFDWKINDIATTKNQDSLSISFTPLHFFQQLSTKRAYSWGERGVLPQRGYQTYLSGGVNFSWKFLRVEIQPEITISFPGANQDFMNQFSEKTIQEYFWEFNYGDYPEYYGSSAYSRIWWGQSKLTAQYGAFEMGISTKNIWWGPGQWNSLTFSNNSFGFPHLTINTIKPAKTFLGHFEAQLLIGKLASSNLVPTPFEEVNTKYFRPLSEDWRYLNALNITYHPRWVSGLSLGLARTFQKYNESRGNSFRDLFPVFEGFQKKNFFDNGNSVEYDSEGWDQQVSIFGRYIFQKAKMEIYAEFGRRDHAYDWREFILNPEHARAYILGFMKLVELPESIYTLQIRGEVTQQHESVNRYIRYDGFGGRHSWHMHDQVRGFTNFGQALGVGLGPGSNVQTVELSLVENLNKFGVLLERLENKQGFYNRSFVYENEHKPWIDLSLGFLFDKQFDNLLLSSKLQIIHARNYQWQLAPESTPDFPKGENLTSMLGQVSVIYFWKGKEGR